MKAALGGVGAAVVASACCIGPVAFSVTVSYAKGRAEVTYEPANTTPEAIATVITEKSGFKAETQPSAKK